MNIMTRKNTKIRITEKRFYSFFYGQIFLEGEGGGGFRGVYVLVLEVYDESVGKYSESIGRTNLECPPVYEFQKNKITVQGKYNVKCRIV